MQIPLIDLRYQDTKLESELKRAVSRVMDSHHFVLGRSVHELENKIASQIGVPFAVGLNSGSDALYLALLALGVGLGDEVITTPFTFFATAGAISRTGAKPVFVDIQASTFNLDPRKFEKAITPRTKAVLLVHLFGLPCDMTSILSIARKHKLAIVEDAAQAFGAKYDGKPIGSMGDVGCFSFYPTKNLGGAGDGGMLVTRSKALAEKVKRLRDHGSEKKYYHREIGINSRLDEIQAAVLLVKLKYIERWNRSRQKYAATYNEGLRNLPIQLPHSPKGHIYHLYTISTPRRDALATFLGKQGIGTGVYYPLPLHLQPCYKGLGYQKGDFPITENACKTVLSLPMYPELSRGALDRVILAVREFFGKPAK